MLNAKIKRKTNAVGGLPNDGSSSGLAASLQNALMGWDFCSRLGAAGRQRPPERRRAPKADRRDDRFETNMRAGVRGPPYDASPHSITADSYPLRIDHADVDPVARAAWLRIGASALRRTQPAHADECFMGRAKRMQQNRGSDAPLCPSVPVSNASQPPTLYRGSQKHKNRPTEERKGTLCPEWTHATPAGGYQHNPFRHRWDETEAHRLFERAVLGANGRRRFATAEGIAFEAKPTGDGTWHGYPIPWEAVPADVADKWVDDGEVTRRQIKKFWQKDKDDLHWAIESGTP